MGLLAIKKEEEELFVKASSTYDDLQKSVTLVYLLSQLVYTCREKKKNWIWRRK